MLYTMTTPNARRQTQEQGTMETTSTQQTTGCRVDKVNEWAKTWRQDAAWSDESKDKAREWASDCECQECQDRRR